MRDIDDRLQRDLGAIERAAAGGRAGLQLLGAAFLAFLFRLVLVLAAGRLVEHIGKFGRQAGGHDDLGCASTRAS
jgi:hypothetical protein